MYQVAQIHKVTAINILPFSALFNMSKQFLLHSIILSYLLVYHKIGSKSSNRRVKEEDSDNEEADYPPMTGRSATSAVSNSQAPSYPPGIAYSLSISLTLSLTLFLSHSFSLLPSLSLLFTTYYPKSITSFINKVIIIVSPYTSSTLHLLFFIFITLLFCRFITIRFLFHPFLSIPSLSFSSQLTMCSLPILSSKSSSSFLSLASLSF